MKLYSLLEFEVKRIFLLKMYSKVQTKHAVAQFQLLLLLFFCFRCCCCYYCYVIITITTKNLLIRAILL